MSVSESDGTNMAPELKECLFPLWWTHQRGTAGSHDPLQCCADWMWCDLACQCFEEVAILSLKCQMGVWLAIGTLYSMMNMLKIISQVSLLLTLIMQIFIAPLYPGYQLGFTCTRSTGVISMEWTRVSTWFTKVDLTRVMSRYNMHWLYKGCVKAGHAYALQ